MPRARAPCTKMSCVNPALYIYLSRLSIYMHGRTGPISFRGLRPWGQLPEYFFHCLPENQVVLPEYYMIFFLPEYIAIWKILGGCSPPPPSPPPRTPMSTCVYPRASDPPPSYFYITIWDTKNLIFVQTHLTFGQAMEKIFGQETSASRTKLVPYAYYAHLPRECNVTCATPARKNTEKKEPEKGVYDVFMRGNIMPLKARIAKRMSKTWRKTIGGKGISKIIKKVTEYPPPSLWYIIRT